MPTYSVLSKATGAAVATVAVRGAGLTALNAAVTKAVALRLPAGRYGVSVPNPRKGYRVLASFTVKA